MNARKHQTSAPAGASKPAAKKTQSDQQRKKKSKAAPNAKKQQQQRPKPAQAYFVPPFKALPRDDPTPEQAIVDDDAVPQTTQMLLQSDHASFYLKEPACITHTEYSELTPRTIDNNGNQIGGVGGRIFGLIHLTPEPVNEDGIQKIDPRGILIEELSSTITFENVYNSSIEVMVNPPFSEESAPYNIHHRGEMRTLNIEPGKKKSVSVSYNTKNRPVKIMQKEKLVSTIEAAQLPGVELFDFLVKINDQNTSTGQAPSRTTEDPAPAEVVKVEVMAKYHCQPISGAIGYVQQIKNNNEGELFTLLDLGDLQQFYAVTPSYPGFVGANVETAVALPYKNYNVIKPRTCKYGDNTYGKYLTYSTYDGGETEEIPVRFPRDGENTFVQYHCEYDGRKIYSFRQDVNIEEFDGSTATKTGYFLLDDYRLAYTPTESPHYYGSSTRPDNSIPANAWASIELPMAILHHRLDTRALLSRRNGKEYYAVAEYRQLDHLITTFKGITKVLEVLAAFF